MVTQISARSAGIHPSATLAVGNRASELRAQGKPVISFAMGEPDFPTPKHIVEAAQRAAADPAMHKYTNARGLPELREAIAAAALRDIGVKMDPARLLVTNGAKQADFEAWGTLVNPGDEVLLPAPYWTTYPEAIGFFGGVPVEIPTTAETGFKVDVEQLEAARTEATVALLLCTPSNPTGAVYTDDELRSIGAWALEHGITVVSDEIYQRLYYPADSSSSSSGAAWAGDTSPTAPALLRAFPDIAEQAVILNGVAKSYSMTGWRVGWLYAPQNVVDGAARIQSHLTGNVSNVAQRASVAALVGNQRPVDEMRAAFARRRLRALELMRGVEAFTIVEPRGAFYVWADVRKALGREVAGQRATSSQELAQILLDEALVAAVPGEAFGMPGYLRFSYALADEDLETGLERVAELLA